MKTALMQELQALRAQKVPVCLAMPVRGPGVPRLVRGDDALSADAALALRQDTARSVELEGTTWFVRPYNPPLRLVLIGAVHISQPLVTMATALGYAVTLVEPRRAFANPERFPGLTVLDDWPDDALAGLALDARTAVVTLTHDPKLDDPALHIAIRSPAFYVGSLGSRRTHASRVERLTEAGFTEAQIGRIHGPVGLSIGARSPAEIAVSILAEITQALRT